MNGDVVDRSRVKKAAFIVILFLLPFVVLTLIEAVFRLARTSTADVDPYVNVSPFTIFARETHDGHEYALITHRLAYARRNTKFQVQKPENTVRLFVLGGSAAAGWPHAPEHVYSTYLKKTLDTRFPGTHFEVINAAAHGFASFRIRHIFDELVGMDPDAIIVYSGNNEFLEERDYTVPGFALLNTIASSSKFVHWLQSLFRTDRSELPANELNEVAQFFWKKIKRQSMELRSDPVQFEQVKAHYRHTLTYMSEKAARLDIPLFLGTVPVNLRDWLPTVSHNGLDGPMREQWEHYFTMGQRGYLQENYEDGVSWMRRALELEPLHAESHYWLGKLLEASDDAAGALQSFSRARDLDYNPFRAISDFNDAVRQVAASSVNNTLVDLDAAFSLAATTGTPGFDLFLDYVHPNTRGNRLISREIFRSLLEHGSLLADVRVSTEWSSSSETVIDENYDDRFDPEIQQRLFSLYSMNHQYQAAIDNANHLRRLFAKNGVPHPIDAMPPRFRDGYVAFRQYEETRRKYILGEATTADMSSARAMLDGFYEKWHPYGKF